MSIHQERRKKYELFQDFCQQVGFFVVMIFVLIIMLLLLLDRAGHVSIEQPEDICLEYSASDCTLDWENGEEYGEKENCYVDSQGTCRQFYYTIRPGCGLGPAVYLVDSATGNYKYQEQVKQKCIEVECAVWTWNSPKWQRVCQKEACLAYFWTFNTWNYPDMRVIGDKDKICELFWQQGKPEYGYTSTPGYLTLETFNHSCHDGEVHEESESTMTTATLAKYFCRINVDSCNLWYWEDYQNNTQKLMYCVASHTPDIMVEGKNNLPQHIEAAELFYAEVGYDKWEYLHVHEFVNPEFNFFCICLFCGALTKWFQFNVLNRLGDYLPLDKIPFTVYILFWGFIFQVVVEKFDTFFPYDSRLSTMLRVLNNVNPDFLLLVFIPPLIFESSFSSNYHTIRAELGQAMILAVPGVIIAALVTAFFAYYIYGVTGYWTFNECLLFGSIVSATDPVAVVALLKELGASARLSTLIEAESLLNDGSAVVLYNIVLLVVQDAPEGQDIVAIIQKICLLIGGGVLIGLLIAMICVQFLSVTREDSQIEITITILGSYLSYFIAEAIKVSGILSVVFFGLILSKYSTFISPKVEESLHVVWEYLGWLANVMIFFISGVVLSNRINYGDADFISNTSLWWIELGWAIFFFIVIHIARAVAIGICYPFLQRTGYGIRWKNAVIMWAAGLRGAIGLALGLKTAEISFSTRAVDGPTQTRAKEHILFQVCIFVMATLVVNGTSIRWLLKKFGMTELTKTAGIIYAETLDHVETSTKEKIKQMKSLKNWRNTEWDQVSSNLPDFGRNIRLYNPAIRRNLALLDQKLSAINVDDRTSLKRTQTMLMNQLQNNKRDSQQQRALKNDLKNEVRHRYLSAFRASYREQFEEGSCSAKVFRVLTEAAETAMDTDVEMIRTHLQKTWFETFKDNSSPTGLLVQYRLILPQFELPKWLEKLYNSPIRTCVSPRKLINGRISFGTEVALAFLKASRNVSDIMKDFPELMSNIDTKKMFYDSTVASEHAGIEKMVKEVIQKLEVAYEGIVRRVKTKQALMTLLYRQRKYIKKSKHRGMLHEKEFNEAEELILESINNIKKREDTLLNTISCGLIYDLFIEEESHKEIFENCAVVMDVDDAEKNKLFDISKDMVTDQNLSIVVSGLYFVLKGIVSVEAIGDKSISIEAMPKGSTIGAYTYLSKGDPVFSYSAKTTVIGRHIPRKNLDKFIQKSENMRNAIAKLAGMELVNAKYLKFFNNTHQMHDQVCKIMISESKVVFGELGTEVHLASSSFLLLLSGELTGDFLGLINPSDQLLSVASAPQLIVNTVAAKWSKPGCALHLDPERSKYVYNLEGTMRSNRFTKMRPLQAWQLEGEFKEPEFAIFENSVEDDEDPLGFGGLNPDVKLESSSSPREQ